METVTLDLPQYKRLLERSVMNLNGIPSDADEFAKQILAAFTAATSHAHGDPLIQSMDSNRNVLIDGSFDLVAVARHLVNSLERDLDQLRKSAEV